MHFHSRLRRHSRHDVFLPGRDTADEIGSLIGAAHALVYRDLWVGEQWASSDYLSVVIRQLGDETLGTLAIFHPADQGIHQSHWGRPRTNESVIDARHEKQPRELHRSLRSTHRLLNLLVVVHRALHGNELVRQTVVENQLATVVAKMRKIRIVTAEDGPELFDRLIKEQLKFSTRQ